MNTLATDMVSPIADLQYRVTEFFFCFFEQTTDFEGKGPYFSDAIDLIVRSKKLSVGFEFKPDALQNFLCSFNYVANSILSQLGNNKYYPELKAQVAEVNTLVKAATA